ncbi:cyanase [Acidithiobacillus sp. M4-SHS-6]|uniref:cyanase n=1 Tax=Acidithiobacillus sp. M4-SHS-6 TaxID=3383024 RepID=UPI0039BE38D5
MQDEMIDRQIVTRKIINGKRELQLTWSEIAQKLGISNIAQCTAALLGQMPFTSEKAVKVASLFNLSKLETLVLQEVPYRGAINELIPKDPTLYRFYELLQVYGTALKELIHENFGDGIMSAIDCYISIEKVNDPRGDRIKVIIDGKHLKYPDLE